MTDIPGALDLDAIRGRADAATPGPWEHVDHGRLGTFMGCGQVITVDPDLMGGDIAAPSGDCYPRSGYDPLADMAFIANARQDVPALLAEVAALRAEREEFEAEALRRACDAAEYGFRAELDAARASEAHLGKQIEKLAEFIAYEVDGEPSRSEGAVDTAIRLLAARAERTGQIRAPWTPEQVEALNRWQHGPVHPFTCGGGGHTVPVVLVATEAGWHCPRSWCGYTQDWAHDFMARAGWVEAPDDNDGIDWGDHPPHPATERSPLDLNAIRDSLIDQGFARESVEAFVAFTASGDFVADEGWTEEASFQVARAERTEPATGEDVEVVAQIIYDRTAWTDDLAWGEAGNQMARDDYRRTAEMVLAALDLPNRPPTQWAYDQACKALEKHRVRANMAEAERDAANAALEKAREICPFDCDNCHDDECPCPRLGCAGS